jgi:hypothetical protein
MVVWWRTRSSIDGRGLAAAPADSLQYGAGFCNAPGVVGVESDAGNRECNAVLFNALTQHWVLKTKMPQTRGMKIVQQNTRPGTNTFLYYITEGHNN